MAKVVKQKVQPHWLTQEQMARSCGISVKSFQQWNIAPVARIGRCTYYEVAAVLENRLGHQHRKLQPPAEPLGDVELARQEREEKLRLTKAQADGQEIKNAQLRKELAPVQVIEWVVGKAGGQISALFDALPMQLKKRNPKLTAADIELVKRELAKAQNAAAQMTVDLDEYYERAEEGDR